MFTKESARSFFHDLFGRKLLVLSCYHDKALQDMKTLKENLVIWHNLEENPNDVPEEREPVLNENGNQVWYNSDGWYTDSDYYEEPVKVNTPKIWYNIPKFDTDRAELETMTRKELIELILKERGQK